MKTTTTASLRDRVSILKRADTADGQGGRATSWVDLLTESATGLTRFAAQVLPLRASERLEAAAIGATLSDAVVLRYRADITPSMRVSWRPYLAAAAKTLEIHGIHAVDGGRAFVRLECAEVI
jgi:SPP1 family predicted phage head-tail adaptor